MKAFNLIGFAFLLMVLSSCQRVKSINLIHKEFEVKYSYRAQLIVFAQSSIKRGVRVTNKQNNQILEFEMEPDIECIDEPRFFHIDKILLHGKEYQNLLWIEDPFAFVIIDLGNMQLLYNSHGEDGIRDRVEIKSKKNCLGKIRHQELILNDCTLGF